MLKNKNRWVLHQSWLAVGPPPVQERQMLAVGQTLSVRKPTSFGSLADRAPGVKTPTTPKASVGRDADICL